VLTLAELENEASHRRKLATIKAFNLSLHANNIWNSIHKVERNLMIVMWITCSQERTASTHPTPTKGYATTVIHSIPWIQEEEIQQAMSIIGIATDVYGQPLFLES